MTSSMKRLLVFAWAAGLALACQTQEATEQGSETEPAVDAASVREAIAAKDKAWTDAAIAGDAAAIASQYASDAVVLPPNAARVEGSQAIQETFARMVETPISSMTLDSDIINVAAAGDYAYTVGSYTMSGTGPDGSEWSDEGKYTAVWKNVDGDWKIVSDIWNSDLPLAGTESAEAAEEAETAPAE